MISVYSGLLTLITDTNSPLHCVSYRYSLIGIACYSWILTVAYLPTGYKCQLVPTVTDRLSAMAQYLQLVLKMYRYTVQYVAGLSSVQAEIWYFFAPTRTCPHADRLCTKPRLMFWWIFLALDYTAVDVNRQPQLVSPAMNDLKQRPGCLLPDAWAFQSRLNQSSELNSGQTWAPVFHSPLKIIGFFFFKWMPKILEFFLNIASQQLVLHCGRIKKKSKYKGVR